MRIAPGAVHQLALQAVVSLGNQVVLLVVGIPQLGISVRAQHRLALGVKVLGFQQPPAVVIFVGYPGIAQGRHHDHLVVCVVILFPQHLFAAVDPGIHPGVSPLAVAPLAVRAIVYLDGDVPVFRRQLADPVVSAALEHGLSVRVIVHDAHRFIRAVGIVIGHRGIARGGHHGLSLRIKIAFAKQSELGAVGILHAGIAHGLVEKRLAFGVKITDACQLGARCIAVLHLGVPLRAGHQLIIFIVIRF